MKRTVCTFAAFLVVGAVSFATSVLSAQEAEKTENDQILEVPVDTSRENLEQQSSVVYQNSQIKAEIEDEGTPMCRKITGKVLLYIPNVIMDVMDTFSLTVRSGAMIDANIRMTRAFGFGFSWGPSLAAIKDVNRQYGTALNSGYNAQFLFLQSEDISQVDPIGSVQEYWQFGSNFPLPSEEIYNCRTGARDYWALEASAGCLVGAKVGVHPIEIADLLCGIVFIDLKGDDIQLNPVIY